MAGLSNIFGGGESDSNTSHDNDSSLTQAASNVVGLDYSDNSNHSSQDADGSSSSSSEGHNFGFESNTNDLTQSIEHAAGMDSDSSAN